LANLGRNSRDWLDGPIAGDSGIPAEIDAVAGDSGQSLQEFLQSLAGWPSCRADSQAILQTRPAPPPPPTAGRATTPRMEQLMAHLLSTRGTRGGGGVTL
jgi:hypothetical protein